MPRNRLRVCTALPLLFAKTEMSWPSSVSFLVSSTSAFLEGSSLLSTLSSVHLHIELLHTGPSIPGRKCQTVIKNMYYKTIINVNQHCVSNANIPPAIPPLHTLN